MDILAKRLPEDINVLNETGQTSITETAKILTQCDLLIIEGTVTHKMATRVLKIYSQMASPRYVIAMGACALSGGLFHDSYSVVKSVDKLLPVDVYIPGCPPRPEALLQAILMLQNKIRNNGRKIND